MSYPTLTTDPQRVNWVPLENSIKGDPKDGAVIARKRYTKTLTRFTLEYANLSAADMAALKSHYDTVGTVDIFSWTYRSVTYSVRYDEPIDGTDLPADWHPVTVKLVTV